MAHSQPSLRIAIVIPNLNGAGAERSVLRIAHGLIERGHAVDMLLFKANIHLRDEVHDDLRIFALDTNPDDLTRNTAGDLVNRVIPHIDGNFPASKLRSFFRLVPELKWHAGFFLNADDLRRTFGIAHYISQERPDCIIANFTSAETAAMLGRCIVGASLPLITVVHDPQRIGAQRFKKQLRYNRQLREADRIVAVSNGVADGVSRVPGIAREKITTIYNPVVTPDISRLSALIPQHPWLSGPSGGGGGVVLAAGRLHEVKDHPTLLNAFAQVSRLRPARLIILGEGEQRSALETLVRELGLEAQVSLPGWVDNPYAFMARADLFVMSSRREGLGNALIEALACGCPAVSTDCPFGPSEILQGGKVGPLVPVGNADMLADAMLCVLEDPPDRESLQRRAAYFSFDKAIDLYDRLITDSVSAQAS